MHFKFVRIEDDSSIPTCGCSYHRYFGSKLDSKIWDDQDEKKKNKFQLMDRRLYWFDNSSQGISGRSSIIFQQMSQPSLELRSITRYSISNFADTNAKYHQQSYIFNDPKFNHLYKQQCPKFGFLKDITDKEDDIFEQIQSPSLVNIEGDQESYGNSRKSRFQFSTQKSTRLRSYSISDDLNRDFFVKQDSLNFSRTFKELCRESKENIKNIIPMIYKQYIAKKNQNITRLMLEDLLNICMNYYHTPPSKILNYSQSQMAEVEEVKK